ncbi:MAG: hypothetical protein KW806_01650 [Candidatus Yanofskybacteria bacterium]|nr:hypothetical protein [Candidatus Yanofskybacteria bacterium]
MIDITITFFHYSRQEVRMKKLLAGLLLTAAIVMNTKVALQYWILPTIISLGNPVAAAEGVEEIIDSGTYELKPGETVAQISIERDANGQLILRVITRPSSSKDVPRTRALYIKDGIQ